jgi:cell division transport system permease protein
MTIKDFLISPSDARLLPEGRLAGPMPWIIAIMMFLTVLATSAGLSLGRAARGIDADLTGKLTVQIVEANAAKREAQVRAITMQLARLAAVESVTKVSDAEMAKLLEPSYGDVWKDPDFPLPAMIDISLARASDEDIKTVRAAVEASAPGAKVVMHAEWLKPIARLLGSLTWLSVMLVILMAGATASIVVLTARAALNTHQGMIEVLHWLGSSDAQISGLFQRKIALDALIGGAIGLGFALIAIALIGSQVTALGSGLLGGGGLGWLGWIFILLLPIFGAVVATLAARFTILAALRRIL